MDSGVDVGSQEHGTELDDGAAVAVDAGLDIAGAFIIFIHHGQEVGGVLGDEVIHVQQDAVIHGAFHTAGIGGLELVGIEQVRIFAAGDGGVEERAVIIHRRMHEFQCQTGFLFNLLDHGMIGETGENRSL